MRRALGDRSGFSIAEMLVAGFVAMILSGTAWVLVSANQKSWSQGDALVATTDQTRIALYRLTGDLRQRLASTLVLPNPPGPDSPLLAGNEFSASVTATPVTGLVVYTLVAQGDGRMKLERRLDGATTVVARDVTTLKYTCPKESGDPPGCPVGPPKPTSLLRITLETTQDALLIGGGKRPISTRMSTQVALRRSAP